MVISSRLNNMSNKTNLLAKILEVTKDAVITVDDDSIIVIFNKGAEEIFGYDGEEVINQTLDVILPEYVKGLHAGFVKRFDQENPVEAERVSHPPDNFGDYHNSFSTDCFMLQGVRKDGEHFPIEATITKTVFEGEKYFTAIIRDVTERTQHIRKIEAQHAELEKYRKGAKRKWLDEVKALAETPTVLSLW